MSAPGVLDWLYAPATDRGVHFAGAGEDWDHWSYRRLAAAVGRVAGELRAAGVGPGDAVALAYPTGPDFLAAFYAALVVGATPAALPTPAALADAERYRTLVRRVVSMSGAALLVTDEETAPGLNVFTDAIACPIRVLLAPRSDPDGPLPPAAEPGAGLMQFSSGSTGVPKGVRLTLDALAANVAAIRAWLGAGPSDVGVTWLPLHHDMGLVGGLLMSCVAQMSLWMMRPEQFVRSPARWLRTLSERSATITVTPNFGLDHVARRVRSAAAAGLDLSALRAVVIGAERVRPETLSAFGALAGPLGFDNRAFVPAYGLAEAGLAVTGSRPGHPVGRVALSVGGLEFGRPVDLAGDVGLVGCGPVLPGMSVAIVDDTGAELPSGSLGEIVVAGPSLATALLTADGAVARAPDEPLPTGDAGFLHDGELYVLGRLGDGIKVRGTWLFAEDLDPVAQECSPRPRQTVVLLGELAGAATAVVLLENGKPAQMARIGEQVRGAAPGVRVLAATVPTGWIQRTTSGKVRRGPMWEAVLGRIDDGFACWDSTSEELRSGN